ncbi:MAG: entericidin A/B family lipoprotein [Pseudomonadota bacterium]
MTTITLKPTALLKLAAVAILLAVAGCNTISGFGEDVQSGGRAVEDTADDVQDDMND